MIINVDKFKNIHRTRPMLVLLLLLNRRKAMRLDADATWFTIKPNGYIILSKAQKRDPSEEGEDSKV
jgi:hypothetical protein